MLTQKFAALCLLFCSLFANAAIVSTDLYVPGDGLITFDTISRLEWLDVGETGGRSYNEIRAQFGAGGDFQGWRHATRSEVDALYLQFGFVLPNDYRGNDPTFRPAFELFNSFFGKPGRTNFYAMFGLPEDASIKGYMPMAVLQPQGVGGSAFIDRESGPDYLTFHHLVRVSDVPIPGAALFLASGLAMLIGAGRRRK